MNRRYDAIRERIQDAKRHLEAVETAFGICTRMPRSGHWKGLREWCDDLVEDAKRIKLSAHQHEIDAKEREKVKS